MSAWLPLISIVSRFVAGVPLPGNDLQGVPFDFRSFLCKILVSLFW